MISSYIQKATNIKPSEIKIAVVSFLFVFILFASYMILKPVRDSMPSDWGDVALATQWTYTFICSTIAVTIYNFIAAKVKMNYLVPGIFVFFSLSFIFFYFGYKNVFTIPHIGKIFYIWISIFSLFHVSVFWGFMTENFSKEQSKRIFGFITTGASIGAIVGPTIVTLILSANIPESTILLITSLLLLSVVPLIFYLNVEFKKIKDKDENKVSSSTSDKKKLSNNLFSGFQEFKKHPKLIGIASFIFLYTAIGTFFYYIQTNVLEDYSRGERRQILGSIELITNALTILIGVLGTNRLITKFGLSTSLPIIPFFIGALILLLSLHPAVWMVLAFQVIRRSGNYAITRPSREILFTSVDSDARFKTKPLIDVAIYRGGDVFWVWVLALLGEGYFNLSLVPILLICCSVAIVWGIVGFIIGKKYDKEEENLS
ncbi:MFS transporter [Polaribacter sp.]|nr:MFS transporter [Polaribacter sp.]